MSKRLTKEQISKLSPEQLDLIGEQALEDGRKHRALLEAAKGNRIVSYGSAFVLTIGFALWSASPESEYLIPFLGVLAAILIEAHAYAINARIDATNSRIDAVIALSDFESIPCRDETESDHG